MKFSLYVKIGEKKFKKLTCIRVLSPDLGDYKKFLYQSLRGR